MRRLCCVIAVIGACGPEPVPPQYDEPRSPTNGSEGLPLLCPGCSPLPVGGDTTDFGGAPPSCKRTVSEVSRGQAAEAGYPVDRFWSIVEEDEVSEEIVWRHITPPQVSTVTATIRSTDRYRQVQRTSRTDEPNDACFEFLEVGVDVTLSTSDQSVVGSLSGYAALEKVAFGTYATFTFTDGQGKLRGHLPLAFDGAEYEHPEALLVETTLSVPVERSQDARMRILVQAAYDLKDDPGLRIVAFGESPDGGDDRAMAEPDDSGSPQPQ